MRAIFIRWLRRLRDERGSQSLEAAGAALAAAAIVVALLSGANVLGVRVEQAYQCAASAISGGGGNCGTGGQNTSANGNPSDPRVILAANPGAPSQDPNDPEALAEASVTGPGGNLPTPEELAEYSAQHRAVQLYFITVIRPGASMEVPIPGSGPNGGTGRADLKDGNEIWEVKPARPWYMDGTGQAQLNRYLTNAPGTVPGSTYEQFIVPYGANQEIVVKSYGQPGMLYYYVRNRTTPDPQPVPVPVPVPVPAPQTQDNTARDTAIIGGGVLAGGGLLWWLLKGASPICGPAMPVCAIIF